MKTIKELSQDSIDVQDACNGIAVVNGLSRLMTNLKESGVKSTYALNTHPLVTLWLDKLASLNKSQNHDMAVSKAYDYALNTGATFR